MSLSYKLPFPGLEVPEGEIDTIGENLEGSDGDDEGGSDEDDDETEEERETDDDEELISGEGNEGHESTDVIAIVDENDGDVHLRLVGRPVHVPEALVF